MAGKNLPYAKWCLYLTNLSTKLHENQGHISVIWIWKKPENPDSPHLKIVYILTADNGIFSSHTPPSFLPFSIILNIVYFECLPKGLICVFEGSLQFHKKDLDSFKASLIQKPQIIFVLIN